MDNFDQGQSPRLGQRYAPENPGVQLRTLETLPEVAYRGMQVYLIDLNQTWVFDGEVWQAPEASSSAGGRTYVGPDQPTADNVGDQWLNTTDYQLYVWDGTRWTPVSNPIRQNETSRAAIKLALGFQSMSWNTGSPTAYYMTSEPIYAITGDVWVNVVNNVVSRKKLDTTWEAMGEPTKSHFLDAEVPRHLIDFKVQVFFGPPATDLGPEDIGDVWVANVIKVWVGAQWIDTQILPEELPREVIREDHIGVGVIAPIHIGEDAIENVHIADGAVGPPQIEEDAVRQIHLAQGSVGPIQIEENAIENFHLAEGAVGPGIIQPGTIQADDLANFVFTAKKFNTKRHNLY